jgi:hypothetical protein
MAQKPPIVLTGALTETDLGLTRRNEPKFWQYLPPWLRDKPLPLKLQIGVWEGSEVSFAELNQIAETFQHSQEGEIEVDMTSYTLDRYPTKASFESGEGAIVFQSDGTTQRIAAPWQQSSWPKLDSEHN